VPRAKKVFDGVWPRVALVGAILLVWWAVHETGLIDRKKLPSPADVWNAFTTNLTGENGLLPAARGSLIRLAFGLSVAVVVGTLIGFAMVASVVVQRSIGTLMTALQALPSIAWLPLAIVWFDFSERAVMFVVFIGGVPAVAIATAISIRQVPPTSRGRRGRWGPRGGRCSARLCSPPACPAIGPASSRPGRSRGAPCWRPRSSGSGPLADSVTSWSPRRRTWTSP
jgi:NitT/TauT family transport system permease protein